MNCLIIEDDKKASEIAAMLLKEYFPSLHLIGIASNLNDAEIQLQQKIPDILITDINLPEGTVFDLLKKQDTGNIAVVFTTAYSKYAIEAFQFSALDFLLKPYTPQDFVKAIQKAIDAKKDRHLQQQIEAFFHNYQHKNLDDKKIALKSSDSIDIVPVRNIILAQADNNYTIFKCVGGKTVLASKPLMEFEKKLADYGFMRSHQSYLVNKVHIESFDKKEMALRLAENQQAFVSQGKKGLLTAFFDSL